jgi:hypothetical protein
MRWQGLQPARVMLGQRSATWERRVAGIELPCERARMAAAGTCGAAGGPPTRSPTWRQAKAHNHARGAEARPSTRMCDRCAWTSPATTFSLLHWRHHSSTQTSPCPWWDATVR